MQIFDLKNMPSFLYAEREKNVFFKRDEFKARTIELKPGGSLPACQMECYVVFYVISGSAQVTVNYEIVELDEGQCLVSEPALFAMKTESGVRMMGIPIRKG